MYYVEILKFQFESHLNKIVLQINERLCIREPFRITTSSCNQLNIKFSHFFIATTNIFHIYCTISYV